MIIKFKYSKRRKVNEVSNFNAKLSDYWQRQLNDMFKNWGEE